MRLDKKTARAVEQTESGFDLVEDGVYRLRLREVESGEGPKGPLWKWIFEIRQEGVPRSRLFHNTSLSEAARFKMKETFEAFSVPADTDTDELIGSEVEGVIGHRTLPIGTQRAGEEVNQIESLRPLPKGKKVKGVVVPIDPDDDEEVEEEEEEDDEEEEEEEVAPARAARRVTGGQTKPQAATKGRPTVPARTALEKKAAQARRASADDDDEDDEPPF